MNKEIKVLLVDDETDFTQPMAFWFKSKGYSVDISSSGAEALKAITENPPDIAFLDMNMPEMDGLETLKRLRKINAELPVIIISAYVGDERVRQAGSYGVSGVFYKGSDLDEGLVLLETVLRMHKKLQK